ncbi:MAG: adenine deaminase [Fusobacteria bacterium]|nr:MAG: adenine deaminase [Fusobacteriota bacterium]KAF0228562.1 MAG: hypothetical protein FD182_818 [Fusobacteriota bacterium]
MYSDILEKNTKELIDVTTGKQKADLLINNLKILDVYTDRIIEGSLLIKKGRIVSINSSHVSDDAVEQFDGQGLYAIPGLIDPHFHVDSCLATPAALADGIVPWGTTTLCGEVLDIAHYAHILGKDPVKAAKLYLKDMKELPYRLLPMAPGKMIPVKKTKELLDWEYNFGLGEMLPHNILGKREEYLDLIDYARKQRKFISGHVLHRIWDFPNDNYDGRPDGCHMITENEIDTFPIVGYSHDHEIFNYNDLITILGRGMNALVRTLDGMAKEILPGIINNKIPTDNINFSIDDLHIHDIKNNGHLNFAIQEAINLGMAPIKAIKMATINNARLIGLDSEIGSLTPGRYADIVLLSSLANIKPEYVFKEGILVAEKGHLVKELIIDYSELKWKLDSSLQELTEGDLEYQVNDNQVTVYDIDKKEFNTLNLSSVEDVGEDVIYGYILDRARNKKIIKILLKGFKINEGAMAVSFSHNSSKIIAAGKDKSCIIKAIKEVDRHLGGIVAVDSEGAVIDFLELDIAAVASSLSCKEIVQKMQTMEDGIRKYGGGIDNIFMVLWFVGFLYIWD